jgi:hypothetical protein
MTSPCPAQAFSCCHLRPHPLTDPLAPTGQVVDAAFRPNPDPAALAKAVASASSILRTRRTVDCRTCRRDTVVPATEGATGSDAGVLQSSPCSECALPHFELWALASYRPANVRAWAQSVRDEVGTGSFSVGVAAGIGGTAESDSVVGSRGAMCTSSMEFLESLSGCAKRVHVESGGADPAGGSEPGVPKASPSVLALCTVAVGIHYRGAARGSSCGGCRAMLAVCARGTVTDPALSDSERFATVIMEAAVILQRAPPSEPRLAVPFSVVDVLAVIDNP